MSAKKYTIIQDFLEDTSFKNWVFKTELADVNFWNTWIDSNPGMQPLTAQAKDILIGFQGKETPVAPEKIANEWAVLKQKIKQKERAKKSNKRQYTWVAIAASILLIFTIGRYSFSNSQNITHSTTYGETLALKLQDGSHVTLNANSSITYSKENYRKVWLTGEAFFVVDKKQTTNAKFWVLTDDLEVEVYGTMFNVNTKKDQTQVYLQEGAVWLALKNGTAKKMVPGNFIAYSAKKDEILEEKTQIEASEKISWKSGVLTFDKLSLEKALEKVTETYGYEVVFTDSAQKELLITGAVPTTNLEICLQAIEKSVHVKITKENTKLVVSKKRN